MQCQERFEQAMLHPNPAQALRALARQLATEGMAKREVYDLFCQFLQLLRTKTPNIEVDQDLIMDVMDALLGWCHPDAQLLMD